MTQIYDKPSSVPWPPIVLAALVGMAIALARVYPLDWPGINDLPARVIGGGIGLLGIALLIWSIVTLRRHDTTVMPHAGSEVLVTDGPYRFRRNPIYIADVLILLGLAEITKNVWFVAAAITFVPVITWLAIIPEEKHLEARFGDAYRAYKAKTRRWI